MAVTVKDFHGHDLHVGDIAITGAFGDGKLTWVRVLEVDDEKEFGVEEEVCVLPLDCWENPDVNNQWWFEGEQLIWHSSDYPKVPNGYLFDLFVNKTSSPVLQAD